MNPDFNFYSLRWIRVPNAVHYLQVFFLGFDALYHCKGFRKRGVRFPDMEILPTKLPPCCAHENVSKFAAFSRVPHCAKPRARCRWTAWRRTPRRRCWYSGPSIQGIPKPFSSSAGQGCGINATRGDLRDPEHPQVTSRKI